MSNLSERIEDIELLDDQGQPVRVGSAWDQRTALVVFIRHFG